MTHLVTVSGLPVQRACRAAGLGRSTYARPLVAGARWDALVIAALTTLVAVPQPNAVWAVDFLSDTLYGADGFGH